jgi:hypothetical protein
MKFYCLLLSLLLLSACAAAPTPTASPTPLSTATQTLTHTPSPAATLTAIPVRATADRPTAPSIRDVTFPPTFTATATYTATPSPTMTYTPSPTPTLTTSELCELFVAGTSKASGATYRIGEVLFFRLDTQGVTGVTIQAEFNHVDSDFDFDLEFPGGDQLVLTMNPVDFAEAGAYTWRATLSTDDESDLCLKTGSFVIEQAGATPELTEEATEEATPDMTEAVQIITATPLIRVVTATPESTAEATAETTEEATPETTEEATPEAD